MAGDLVRRAGRRRRQRRGPRRRRDEGAEPGEGHRGPRPGDGDRADRRPAGRGGLARPTCERSTTARRRSRRSSLSNTGILSHIQDVAASEQGLFFIAADGTATFFDRHHTVTLEDDDTWGELEKNYASVTTSYDESNLWNEVVVTAEGLTDQTASDTASQSLYGGPAIAPRTLSVPTLLTTEADMVERAEALLAKYSEPEFRITSLEIYNGSGVNDNWPRIFVHDLHARILVRRRPVGDMISQPSFIEGIGWEIGPGVWETYWSLSSTLPQVGQWELGTVGLSELGVTTSLVNTI